MERQCSLKVRGITAWENWAFSVLSKHRDACCSFRATKGRSSPLCVKNQMFLTEETAVKSFFFPSHDHSEFQPENHRERCPYSVTGWVLPLSARSLLQHTWVASPNGTVWRRVLLHLGLSVTQSTHHKPEWRSLSPRYICLLHVYPAFIVFINNSGQKTYVMLLAPPPMFSTTTTL